MIWVHFSSVLAWVLLGAIAGFVAGVRIWSHIHFTKLKGALCEKCLRGFWNRYNDEPPD